MKAGVDIQQVEYEDQISFFDGEELGRYEFDGSFTGNAFADFLLGLPRFTGYILPAPDVNPYADLLRVLRAGRLAADADADDQLRSALRPAAADARSQQPAGKLRSRLPWRPRRGVR